jgi:hypothetical protein
MNIRIVACSNQIELSNKMKEIITTFFPCDYFIKPITFLETEIERFLKKEEYRYCDSENTEDVLIIFWDNADLCGKEIINRARRYRIPTFIYYLG